MVKVVVVWAESSTSVGQRSNTFWRGQEQLIKKRLGHNWPLCFNMADEDRVSQVRDTLKKMQKNLECPIW